METFARDRELLGLVSNPSKVFLATFGQIPQEVFHDNRRSAQLLKSAACKNFREHQEEDTLEVKVIDDSQKQAVIVREAGDVLTVELSNQLYKQMQRYVDPDVRSDDFDVLVQGRLLAQAYINRNN